MALYTYASTQADKVLAHDVAASREIAADSARLSRLGLILVGPGAALFFLNRPEVVALAKTVLIAASAAALVQALIGLTLLSFVGRSGRGSGVTTQADLATVVEAAVVDGVSQDQIMVSHLRWAAQRASVNAREISGELRRRNLGVGLLLAALATFSGGIIISLGVAS